MIKEVVTGLNREWKLAKWIKHQNIRSWKSKHMREKF